MNRYLLVLYKLDDCEGLLETARVLAKADPTAEFVLLTPAAAAAFDLLLEPSPSSLKIARRRAQKAHAAFLAAGINIAAARLGNFDPFRAVEDATRFCAYTAVVVAAPPHPLLHLMRCDLCCRLARRFPDAPVIHALSRGRSWASVWDLEAHSPSA